MKTYLVFWTFSANYADKFARLQTEDVSKLAEAVRSRFSFYRNEWFNEAKLHIVEVGGDVVFEGSWIELLRDFK